jgi:hypothetical protein
MRIITKDINLLVENDVVSELICNHHLTRFSTTVLPSFIYRVNHLLFLSKKALDSNTLTWMLGSCWNDYYNLEDIESCDFTLDISCEADYCKVVIKYPEVLALFSSEVV